MTRGTMSTQLGQMTFELYDDAAPASVAAFIEAVEAGAYNDAWFGRVVHSGNDQGSPQITVIQSYSSVETPAVQHETTERTGLRHVAGTLSLPRAEPGTATGAGLFICLEDTPALDFGALRNADGQGFAAFGRVTSGLEVAEQILRGETIEDSDIAYVRGQMLREPVAITNVTLEP